ncbi:MAG: bifunctional oligoribonuclease/PAP phosphatase NrnA [Gammaproteobacteria bacterium]|nr:bifunctional oligoribonuclease/PAP phosphatase NrnA [Gammaproteobacteria bacterium]
MSSLDAAVAELRDASEIAVACHVGPDGDAIGSALGLAASARLAGRSSVVSFGEPFVLPPIYEYLPLEILVSPKEFPAQPEVMVSVDAASLDRLGSLVPSAKSSGSLIVIDHHISNPGFGDVNVIDAEAAASAQIVFRLLGELAWPIDETVATALLTGIVTDTGRFQYSSTSPEVLRIAAELVEAGAHPEIVGQNMYERVPFSFLKLEGDVLARAELDGDIVWSVLYQEDLTRWGIGMEDTDPLIDVVRLAWEATVAVLIKELADGTFKVSLRSRGEVDVGVIASAYGGGGHHNAAGFSHAGPPDAIIAALKARL